MAGNNKKIKVINEQGTESFLQAYGNNPWEKWGSADDSLAPHNLGRNTIGFSTDGRMWDYTAYNDTWTVTSQTFDGFVGL